MRWSKCQEVTPNSYLIYSNLLVDHCIKALNPPSVDCLLWNSGFGGKKSVFFVCSFLGPPQVDIKVASSTVVVAVYLSCWCCICDQLVLLQELVNAWLQGLVRQKTSEDPKIFMAKFIRGSSLLGRAKAKKQVFVNGGVCFIHRNWWQQWWFPKSAGARVA